MCIFMSEKEIISEIIHRAEKSNIKKVILFGSRATGKAYRTSDFDLAVIPDSVNSLFNYKDSLEEIPTLLMFDVINLQSDMISLDLRDSIEKEGVVLYEEV